MKIVKYKKIVSRVGINLVVISMILLSLGCGKKAQIEYVSSNEISKKDKLESISDKNIIKGCNDYINMSGKSLLNLNKKDRIVSISKKMDLEIIMKRGNPNGMNVRILNKKGDVLKDLMNGDEIDERITDEFGMPRKNIDYEVGLYDLDRDNFNEIIFSVRTKSEILGYVYKVKEEKYNIEIQFASKFKKTDQKTLSVDEINM